MGVPGFSAGGRYLSRKEVVGSLEGLTQEELVTTGVYGIVRHPLYVASIIIFTFSPNITVNGLTITVLADFTSSSACSSKSGGS